MGQFYEVQFTKRLDGTDNYGNVTDSIKFTSEEQSVLFKHQPKTVVEQGTKLFGRIDELPGRSGKLYRKFVREQQEDQGFTPQPSTSQPSNGSYSKSGNNDGMRQGMCYNNAVNYIAARDAANGSFAADADAWAKEVITFARALYLTDITAEADTSDLLDQDLARAAQGTLLDDIDDMFPTPKSNPGTDAQ